MVTSESGGQSTLNGYDISTATLNPIKDLTVGSNPVVANAIGYSETQQVFWGVRAYKNPPVIGVGPDPDHILRIDSEGNVDDIGAPGNLTTFGGLGFTDFLALAGTVEDDELIVHTKEPENYLFKIDVDPNSPTLGEITDAKELSRITPGNPDNMLNIGDWDFNHEDGKLYGIELSGGTRLVTSIDPASGDVSDGIDLSGELPDSDNYGAVFMEKGSQTLYTSANNVDGAGMESQTFEVRLEFDPPVVKTYGTGPDLKINDGADCLLATDFGDAPDSYLTSDAAGGPGHVLSSVFDKDHDLFLGSTADSDLDGFPNADATTDDTNLPVNDEDAVPAGTMISMAGPALTVPITNTTGEAATLAGWLDLNRSGTFEPGELATASLAAGDTSAILTWPSRTESGAAGRTGREEQLGQAMLRLRLYAGTVSDPQPGAWVNGGEVEDHLVILSDLPVSGASLQPVVKLGGGLLGLGLMILSGAWLLGRQRRSL